jgi:hypothetical protein
VANCRVSTNTKNSNQTAQDKKNPTKTKNGGSAKVFGFKHVLLNASANLQIAFAAEARL